MQEFLQNPKKQHGTSEASGHTTGRLDHPNPEEAEEKQLLKIL